MYEGSRRQSDAPDSDRRVGPPRAPAALCGGHPAYRWLCGGVEVGYHTRADFRTGRGDVLGQLLTDAAAVLLHEDLIDLKRAARDGPRGRAAAGASSFRRGATIEKC